MKKTGLEERLAAIVRPLGAPRWPMAVPTWAHLGALAVMLGVCWAAAYLAGGGRTALPHAFYLPIVLAGVLFGTRGSWGASLAATILSGPLLPLDVAAGTAQTVANWLSRGVFFALVGTAVGVTFAARQRAYTSALEARISHDMRVEAGPGVTGGPPGTAADARTIVEVRNVLDHDVFHPVFQPIYALGDGQLRAVEALTRFDTPAAETPDVWFRRARHAGLETELDLAVMAAAMREAQDVLPTCTPLSLNCAPTTICDPRLPVLLDRFAPRGIILEITEHEVVDDYRELEQALPALRGRGVRLAVDDAGAGFASLRHILRLSPEIIKLDTSLTQGLRHDPVRRTLAECLVRFATDTGSELVAEGIEDAADLTAWRELGADSAQGYLLGRPGPLPCAPRSHHIAPPPAGPGDRRDGLRAS